MNDLISRKDALDEVGITAYGFWHHEVIRKAYEYLMRNIKALPAVDAVEVVRCKDCKYFMQYTKEYAEDAFGDGDCRIRVVSGADDEYCFCFEHYYCSWGERKENENN